VKWTIQVPTSGGFDVLFLYAAANYFPVEFILDENTVATMAENWRSTMLAASFDRARCRHCCHDFIRKSRR
jgi:hypothetical protein